VREHAVSCAASGIPSLRQGPWKLVMAADLRAGTDVQLYQLDDDIGESRNVAAANPELVATMRAAFDKFIRDGRSTPGAPQKNDVEVVRHPQPTGPAGKAKAKAN
jgi:hypothetical protein